METESRAGTMCLFWVPFFTVSCVAHAMHYKGTQAEPRPVLTEASPTLRAETLGAMSACV